MADASAPLTDEERAELELLRAEKAERERAAQARAERAELERLRAERSAAASRPPQVAREDARIREARERGRRLMEPDDDLAMPLGQRLVLIGVALIALALCATFVFGSR